MKKFDEFLLLREEGAEEMEYPVIQVSEDLSPDFSTLLESNSNNLRTDINQELDEVTSNYYSWPHAGYEAIMGVLSEFGLHLPEGYDALEDSTGEQVFCIEGAEDLYLYVFHEPSKYGKTEFYAELVNEKELNEVLDSIDVGEDDNEDDYDNDETDNDEESDQDNESE